MIKKTFQSFAFFTLFQLFIFSCCTEEYNLYYETLYLVAEDQEDGDATTVNSENLILNFETLFDYVIASNYKALKRFKNSAYATTCDENYTLKEHVSEITITADHDILGITAGNSLNSKLSYINPETQENEPVENVISILNDGNNYNYYRKDFVLNEAVLESTTLAFTITITIEENGRILNQSTDTITIE